MLPGKTPGEGDCAMSDTKDLTALARELEAVRRLLERTQDPHQRRLFYRKAFQLLRKLSEE